MLRKIAKKVPFKEVNGYYRLSYGNPAEGNYKDYFDPDEDED
jgi:hypothetical protein